MDDRGFVFTTDAVLALVIFFVFTASILTYYTLPSYIGADHQHLETIAADALDVMTQDGTLYATASGYAGNNISKAKVEADVRAELDSLLPNGTAYNLTIKGINGTTYSIADDKGISVSKDTVTRVVVLSGPRQGWLGRAWYKLEDVQFINERRNSTTTLWNFHNWLTNFSPWGSSGRSQLATYYYWGSASGRPSTSIPITFSFPSDANITGAYYLLGSCNQYSNNAAPAYGADVSINGYVDDINSTDFLKLYNRPGTGNPGYPMFNYRGTVNASRLLAGLNSINYVRFTSPVSNYQTSTKQGHNMPWFSIIGNYSNSIPVPQGIITRTFKGIDAAGLAVPVISGAPAYAKVYDLDTRTITTIPGQRTINWNSMVNQNFSYSDGVPFDILNLPSGDDGCAVSMTYDLPIPSGSRIFDAYTVVNAYGGVDSALVEVWDGTKWNTVFNSFDLNGTDYSSRSDGYGNTPGTLYIGDYLRSGTTNKVRVTIWDNVPGNDYDLVGLVNCYSTVSYSALPIKWDTFDFPSYQNSTNFTQPVSSFDIGSGAEKAFMFFGTGLDTKSITVQVKNSTSPWKTLYSDNVVPFVLDIGNLDLSTGSPIFTSGTVGNYTCKPGHYDVRVTLYSSPSWQSGDGASSPAAYSNAEIYSGTRVGIVYPKFLANMWASDFADDPYVAQAEAKQNLIDELIDAGFTNSSIDPNLIKTEALYTGNLPNAISIRLDLWRD
ncbi:MAG: hypothetical protein CVV28_09515 [Methanobacteriales archaeon HGW-Methanobacteriales-1]|jgi:hypothetical protein|nr:MAG: hypothetical protein CVV28_09515 [Methanobacteriales archaeon HGW-Methanobacteriales-1]